MGCGFTLFPSTSESGSRVKMCESADSMAACRRLDRGEEVEGMRERIEAIGEAAELEDVPVEELRVRRKGFRFLY
jgi:hypothetical protein